MPGELISVTFKLHSLPDYVHVKEGYGGIACYRLALFGSVKELGLWDLRKHIRVFPSAGFSKWETQVLVPANATFEWSWIVTDFRSKKVLFWDPCRRTSTVGNFNGTLHTAWGRPEQAFRCDTCRVTVSTHYKCEPGQIMMLTGGEPLLGDWDPQHSVVATEEYPSGSGTWRANLVVEKLSEFLWKWVVVDAVSRQPIHWEQGAHHFIYVDHGVSFIEIDSPWEAGDFRLSQSCCFSSDEDKDNEINALATPQELPALDEMAYDTMDVPCKNVDDTTSPGEVTEMAGEISSHFRPGSYNRSVCPSPSLQQDICSSQSFQQNVCQSPSFPQNVCQSQSFQQNAWPSASFQQNVCPSPSFQQNVCSSPSLPQNMCSSQRQNGYLPQRSETNLWPWQRPQNNAWPWQRFQNNVWPWERFQNNSGASETGHEETGFRAWANTSRRWADRLVNSIYSFVE